MAQITNILPVLSGQTLDADIHRVNFNNIIPKYNEHDRNKTGVHGIDTGTEIGTVKYYTDFIDGVNPVGSILEVWDNEIPDVKALIDTDYYVELDGSTINDAESIFNGLTIPDYTEAYIMIETSSVISNSTIYNSNTLDLTHTHTMEHVHDFAHKHDASATHNHSKDKGAILMYYDSTFNKLYFGLTTPTFPFVADVRTRYYAYHSYTNSLNFGYDINYTVGNTSTSVNGFFNYNSTNITLTYTVTFPNSSTFASPTDIRPYSIKCRRYLRIK